MKLQKLQNFLPKFAYPILRKTNKNGKNKTFKHISTILQQRCESVAIFQLSYKAIFQVIKIYIQRKDNKS